jgi:hypothetical protein
VDFFSGKVGFVRMEFGARFITKFTHAIRNGANRSYKCSSLRRFSSSFVVQKFINHQTGLVPKNKLKKNALLFGTLNDVFLYLCDERNSS